MKLSRRYESSSEFRERQGAFWFADAAQAVVGIALSVRKSLTGWTRKLFAFVVQVKRPHQLVLELDGIAQIPLLGG